MREILTSDELLFDPASPRALVDALKRIIAEPQAALRRLWNASAPARQRLSFDWDSAAAQAATDRTRQSQD